MRGKIFISLHLERNPYSNDSQEVLRIVKSMIRTGSALMQPVYSVQIL